jgi:hypothetical protein
MNDMPPQRTSGRRGPQAPLEQPAAREYDRAVAVSGGIRSLCGLLALATLALPGAALADGTITAVYEGKFDGHFVYNVADPEAWRHDVHLEWKETSVYAVKSSGPNDVTLTLSSSTLTASGTKKASYAPPNAAMSCDATLKLRDGFDAASFNRPSVGWDFVRKEFQALGLAPTSGAQVQSSAGGQCEVPINGGILGPVTLPQQTSPSDWITPELRALYNAPTTTVPFKVDAKTTSANSESHVIVDAALTLTNTGGVPPAVPPPAGPSPAGPEIPADKRAAFRDLGPAVRWATLPCTVEAQGLTLLGTGVLFAGAPGGGLALAVSGNLLAGAFAPTCAEAIKRIISDYRRYKDPPFPDFHTVARPAAVSQRVALPSCKRYPKRIRGYCSDLRAAVTRLVIAARKVSAVDRSLETTVGRQTAAISARDASAVALQAATAEQLGAQMAAALREQGRAGAKIAALLRSRGLRLRHTRAQNSKVIAAVARLVGRKGVSRTDLAAAVPSALQPRASDLTQALANPGG